MRKMIMAAVLVALVPGIVCGQLVEDRWEALKQLRAGRKIQLVDLSFKQMNGKLLKVSEDAISLRVGGKEVVMPRSDVRMVSLPPSRIEAILGGMLAGALLGATAWLEADRQARYDRSFDDDCYSSKKRRGLSPRSAAVFVAAGAGTVGIASGFTPGAGKMIYFHDPRKTVEPVEPAPETSRGQLTEAGKPEGGNVFAPVKSGNDPKIR